MCSIFLFETPSSLQQCPHSFSFPKYLSSKHIPINAVLFIILPFNLLFYDEKKEQMLLKQVPNFLGGCHYHLSLYHPVGVLFWALYLALESCCTPIGFLLSGSWATQAFLTKRSFFLSLLGVWTFWIVSWP